jgi:hypothetical protein
LTAACAGLHTVVGRARRERRMHRALAQERADYATPAERDELAALIAGLGYGDSEVAELQARQAHVGMLRDGNPPFWPFTRVP